MKQAAAIICVAALIACTPTPPPADGTGTSAVGLGPNVVATDDAKPSAIIGKDWALITLGSNSNPAGAGARPVTLRIDNTPNAIAAGFAGCNRYTGPYSLRGDSISFGPSISTKMACADGMDTEQSYLSMLPTVLTYSIADSTLTLFGPAGAVATYRNRTK